MIYKSLRSSIIGVRPNLDMWCCMVISLGTPSVSIYKYAGVSRMKLLNIDVRPLSWVTFISSSTIGVSTSCNEFLIYSSVDCCFIIDGDEFVLLIADLSRVRIGVDTWWVPLLPDGMYSAMFYFCLDCILLLVIKLLLWLLFGY